MNGTKRQRIRPSQFITTYGPGAILEGEGYPRVVLDAKAGLFDPNRIRPDTYRIDDDRMSQGLLDGASIYRLPTSSEMEEMWPYATKRFPEWKLCIGAHGDGYYLLHRNVTCPGCGSGAMGGAVRFVMACSDGHLDDISWHYMVHDGPDCAGAPANANRGDGAFYWRQSGGTLRDITIQCMHCSRRKNFGDMYYRMHKCGGRHPQHEGRGQKPIRRGCKQGSRIMVRQSASLRVAETKTLLSIRQIYTDVHKMLQHPAISISIETLRSAGMDVDENIFKKSIKGLMEKGKIPQNTALRLLGESWNTIKDAIDFVERDVPTTYSELVLEEFRELLKASKTGAPPQAAGDKYGAAGTAHAIFEANRNSIKSVTANEIKFRVTPIQKLRTVTVQTGFRREIYADRMEKQPKIVGISFTHDDKKWYPGVEYMGEGIFISLDEGDGWLGDPADEFSGRWLGEFRGHRRDKYPEYVFRDDDRREEMHPWFVWWHTLAHLLIRTIGEDSGYSSAAIRERVYFERDKNFGSRGGVLLYAARPGNEGTMGGLTGMAPHMKGLLKGAFDVCESCSSDPLCSETRFRSGEYNGASCYACLLNSETSCEHKNMWLDRNVLNTARP